MAIVPKHLQINAAIIGKLITLFKEDQTLLEFIWSNKHPQTAKAILGKNGRNLLFPHLNCRIKG